MSDRDERAADSGPRIPRLPRAHARRRPGALLAALVVHHGVLSPGVLAVGAAVRPVPDRVRGFVQAGLIMAAAVTLIAIPLMIRQFSQPAGKAMLLQHYGINLLVLWGGIVLGTAIAYAIRVSRDRKQSSAAPR